MSTVLPPLIPWGEFYPRWTWAQGEHLTVIGPTGTGKSTLLRACVRKRYEAGGAVVVLATKPRDLTLSAWAREDQLTIVREWPPKIPWHQRTPPDVTAHGPAVPWHYRVMLWPRFQTDADQDNMAAQHLRALRDLFTVGNTCIIAEELHYLVEELGLERPLVTNWTQGRSVGISQAGGTQRPVNIPLYAYGNATHLFFFGDADEVNLKRIQGLGGLSAAPIREMVRSLPEHDVLYVNTRRKVLVRTRVDV